MSQFVKGWPCKQDAKWVRGPPSSHSVSCGSSGEEASLAHLCSGIDIFPAEDSIAEGCGGVVIDELQHLKASHTSSLQHSSALSLVEKGWHGDHCILNGLFYRGQKIRISSTPNLRPGFSNSTTDSHQVINSLTGPPYPLHSRCQEHIPSL